MNIKNNHNDEDYIYNIDFEKYVDNIVNSDDENDKKNKLTMMIIEKKSFDRDNINYSSNNKRIIYNKGIMYTNINNLNKNNLNRNILNKNNNIHKNIKKVRFCDEIKIINDDNNFKENSPKSIVNFNECNDDVRTTKFNNFIPKGKYVFNKNNNNF